RETLGRRDAAFAGDRAQEAGRCLHEDAAAVAGLAVGGDRAAMREPGQRADRGLDDPVRRVVVEARDQAEAAAIALESRIVKSPCLHVRPGTRERAPPGAPSTGSVPDA